MNSINIALLGIMVCAGMMEAKIPAIDMPCQIGTTSIEQVDPNGDVSKECELFCNFYVQFVGFTEERAATAFEEELAALRDAAADRIAFRLMSNDRLAGLFIVAFPEEKRVWFKRIALDVADSREEQIRFMDETVLFLFRAYRPALLSVIILRSAQIAQQMIQECRFVPAAIKDEGYSSDDCVAFEREVPKSVVINPVHA